MLTQKRPRGRPRGSGKNDALHLAQVADLLIRERPLKPTTAMKRVMRSRKDWAETDATLIRRWQVKWKAEGASLLAVAHDRARPRPTAVPARLTDTALMHAIRQIEDSAFTKSIKYVLKAMESDPFWKCVRDAQNSPWMHGAASPLRGFLNPTPAEREHMHGAASALRGFFDPPKARK